MKSASPFAHLPGPEPMPVLGWRGNLVRFFRDPIGYMAPLPAAYGAVVPFARGGSGAVLTREATQGSVFGFGPSAAQAVWSQTGTFHSTRVPGPKESAPFHRLTSGLFSMNDDRHRQQRRLLQPAFHKTRVDSYLTTMVELTERAIRAWRPGETRDLASEMRPLTLAIADKTLFGHDPSPGELTLGERIQEVVDLAMSLPAMVPLNLPFTPRRRLIDQSARVDADLRAVIERKRATGSTGDDVLAMLLATRDEEGATLTEDELIGQLFVLFFAGHDTTRAALTWTLFLLSAHPEILGAVREELSSALSGAAPTIEQVPRLALLDRVVRESLRLLPPAPYAVRITARPGEMAGVLLPAGTEVIVSPYCLHREPDLYPEPQRFAPGRWEKLAPSPFEYAPFGAGPRMCIGAGFAALELRVVLAILLQRFDFELAEGARIDRRTTVVLSPKHGMPMVLRSPGQKAKAVSVRGDVREMVDLPI